MTKFNLSDFLLKTTKFCVLAVVFLMPLFFYPFWQNAFILPKQYLFYALISLAVVLFFIRAMINQKIILVRTVLDRLIAVFLAVSLGAVIFSSDPYLSFWGKNNVFSLNLLTTFFCVVFYYLTVNIFDFKSKDLLKIFYVLTASGLIGAIFYLFRYFASFYSTFFLNWQTNLFSVDLTYFSLWLIAVFLLSGLVILEKKGGFFSYLIGGATFILVFVCLFVISLKLSFYLLLIALGFLMGWGIYYHKNIFKPVFWLCLALFCLVALSLIGNIFSAERFKLQTEAGMPASYSVYSAVKSNLSSPNNFIFGAGQAMFIDAYPQFSLSDIYANKLFFNTRYDYSFNSVLTMLMEIGWVGFFSFLALTGAVFGIYFYQRKISVTQEAARLNSKLFLVWIYLTIGLIFSFYNLFLWLAWWLFLSLLAIGFNLNNKKAQMEINLKNNKIGSMLFSFFLMFVIGLLIVFGFKITNFCRAQNFYNQSIKETEYDRAILSLNKAVSLRPKYTDYYLEISKRSLSQASLVFARTKIEEQTASLISLALDNARQAVKLSPRSIQALNQMALAYEASVYLDEKAGDWAVKTLEQVISLDPFNPDYYYRLGKIYAIIGEYDKSEKNFLKAIDLKKDFSNAYLSLAGVYEKQGLFDKGVSLYEFSLSQGNYQTDTLYNYGRFLFNRNLKDDRQKALNVWLNLLKKQPRQVNILYSVGLCYEAQKDNKKALEYFEQAQKLDLDNIQISDKINNIKSKMMPL